MRIQPLIAVAGIALACVSTVACNKSSEKTAAQVIDAETKVAVAGHTHEGWWCKEHGVPESVCAQCDSKLVPDFKAKGDWCGKHNRPDSQCFVCHPEKEAEFAALYEAKYGDQPPKPEADGQPEKSDKT